MAESVVLIKAIEEYPIKGESSVMRVERIVGVDGDQSPSLIEQGYQITGNESEELLSLPGDSLARFYEFYKKCRVDKSVPNYDCTSFAAFVSGARNDISIRHGIFVPPIKIVKETPVDMLVAGTTYAVARDVAKVRSISHLVLGAPRANRNLSVTGLRMPVYMTDNTDIRSAYKGTGLVEIRMLR